ncbi:hypothetical protein [Heliorestis acidaminivorans]|uniref:hypothetical protein n=1 Tax=Heliorestis acidaminivorans TaxID=553427 RepID=UPI0014795499|nr:hypothetical protein [Heliorestis acidaminivorans]
MNINAELIFDHLYVFTILVTFYIMAKIALSDPEDMLTGTEEERGEQDESSS